MKAWNLLLGVMLATAIVPASASAAPGFESSEVTSDVPVANDHIVVYIPCDNVKECSDHVYETVWRLICGSCDSPVDTTGQYVVGLAEVTPAVQNGKTVDSDAVAVLPCENVKACSDYAYETAWRIICGSCESPVENEGHQLVVTVSEVTEDVAELDNHAGDIPPHCSNVKDCADYVYAKVWELICGSCESPVDVVGN